ncbi:hypothetical protein HMPREF7545_1165 [Selenomonas noxia ATCC 43541]|nr:hypothetical protein [Selenomonas noxia]EFF66125.1 hypothetical protein HMPREF7545_1165 [Selenomonas noxia ATCC 43541]
MKLIDADIADVLQLSRPAWGAWIETRLPLPRRSSSVVAPRMGRVD